MMAVLGMKPCLNNLALGDHVGTTNGLVLEYVHFPCLTTRESIFIATQLCRNLLVQFWEQLRYGALYGFHYLLASYGKRANRPLAWAWRRTLQQGNVAGVITIQEHTNNRARNVRPACVWRSCICWLSCIT